MITLLALLTAVTLAITTGQLLRLRRDYAEALARIATLRTQIADLADTNNEATSFIYQHQATIDAQRAALAAACTRNEEQQRVLRSRALRVIVNLPESPAPMLTSICMN